VEDHRLDDTTAEPVRSVLEQHVRLGDDAPLLVWRRNGRRRSLRLPHGSDAPAAARESLVQPGATWTLKWAVIVWRAEIEMADGSRVPVRYACIHLAGRPHADLVVQHYTATEAGEVPLGEPEAVDRVAPLIPPWQPRRRRERGDQGWWRTSGALAAGLGLLAGGVAADLTVDAAGRFGPTSVHRATITDVAANERASYPADFTILAQTASGERVDFAYTQTDRLYQMLDAGQPVRVTLSDLTGRPVALDTGTASYNLVADVPEIAAMCLVLAVAGVVFALMQGRVRNRWGLLPALATFVLFGLKLVGFW
jgi:hypothetical protein